jgi:hypothetical protein
MGGPPDTSAAAAAAADALSSRLAAVDLSGGPPGRAAAAAAGGPRVAGLEGPLQALRELIGWPMTHGPEAAALGVEWPRGLLLHGPPGCGKTLLVQEVAGVRARGGHDTAVSV